MILIPVKTNLIIGSRFDNTEEYNSQPSPKFSGIYKFNKDLSLKFSSGYGFKHQNLDNCILILLIPRKVTP